MVLFFAHLHCSNAGPAPGQRDWGGNKFRGGTQGRRQLREIGAAKLKSGEQRFSPKCEDLFWPKSQIFRPKAGDLQAFSGRNRKY